MRLIPQSARAHLMRYCAIFFVGVIVGGFTILQLPESGAYDLTKFTARRGCYPTVQLGCIKPGTPGNDVLIDCIMRGYTEDQCQVAVTECKKNPGFGKPPYSEFKECVGLAVNENILPATPTPRPTASPKPTPVPTMNPRDVDLTQPLSTPDLLAE